MYQPHITHTIAIKIYLNLMFKQCDHSSLIRNYCFRLLLIKASLIIFSSLTRTLNH